MEEKKKIVLGLSGGVDSAVAAYLLQQQGYEVIGVTMLVRPEDHEGAQDAAKVAQVLGIEHRVVDFCSSFRENVMMPFVSEYTHGRTPNPCVICNRKVKWEALLSVADQVGAEEVATGHYAFVEKLPQSGRYSLRMSEDSKKDQSYVLYALTQDQLRRTRMPLGGYTKEQIRQIAAKLGLPVAQKPDSMEICFIPDGNYVRFLEDFTGRTAKPGSFVDEQGHVLGQHKGILHYTIGQRKGLGIAFGKPMFVKEIRAAENEVVLSGNEALFSQVTYVSEVNFMGWASLSQPRRAEAKIRYAHKASPCTVEIEEGRVKCTFDIPQRAITPGQSLVVYDGPWIALGGIISEERRDGDAWK